MILPTQSSYESLYLSSFVGRDKDARQGWYKCIVHFHANDIVVVARGTKGKAVIYKYCAEFTHELHSTERSAPPDLVILSSTYVVMRKDRILLLGRRAYDCSDYDVST